MISSLKDRLTEVLGDEYTARHAAALPSLFGR